MRWRRVGDAPASSRRRVRDASATRRLLIGDALARDESYWVGRCGRQAIVMERLRQGVGDALATLR